MQVTVEHPDGSQTVYFGASDPEPQGDNGIRVWLLSGRDDLPNYLDTEGEVTRTVDEMTFNQFGDMVDHMLNILADPSAEVVVRENPYYSTALEVAREIRDEDDFEGELTIHAELADQEATA